MFVRLLIALAVLSVSSFARATPEQEATFVLTVKEPVGGKAALHKGLVSALEKREEILKPKLLEKTKAHHASRLDIKLKLAVDKGLIKATSIDVNYRDAKGTIADDSIKPVIEDALKKTKSMSKDLNGATVEMTIAILQP